MKMSAERTVRRPAAEVFEYFSDASNNPEWQHGMRSCEWTSQPPIRVGSTYEQHAKFAGRDIRSVFEVTAYDPGRMIEITTVASTFPIRVVRTVTPIDDTSCEVSADISGGPEGGLYKLLEPIMVRQAQRSVDRDYDRLVEILDSHGETSLTD